MRKCEKNSPVETQISEEEGEGKAPGAGAKILLEPREKPIVKQVVFLQSMEDHVRGDIHTVAHRGIGLLAGTVAHGGPRVKQSDLERLYPVKSTFSGAFPAELHPVRRTCI